MFTQIELKSDIQFPTVLNSFPMFTQNIFLPLSTLYSYRYLGVNFPVLIKSKNKRKKRERERNLLYKTKKIERSNIIEF